MRVAIGVVVVTASVFAAATPTFAQGVTGGLKFGVTFASLDVDEEEGAEFKTKTGVIAGGFLGIGVSDMISIQPEVLFAQKGANIEDGGDEGTLKLDYLEIPILAVARFGTAGATRPFIAIGPSFGLNLDAKLEINDVEEEGFEDGVKGSEMGLVLGAGVEMARFLVEGRYNLGLTNIAEEGDEVKTRAFSILLGVRF